MPILFAPFISAFIGLLYAIFGRDEIRRTTQPAHQTRGFLFSMLSAILLVAPLAGYFLAFYPDWSYAYFLSSAKVPSAFDLLFVLFSCAILPLSYVWSANTLRRYALQIFVQGIASLVFLFVVLFVMLAQRLSVAGDYHSFTHRFEMPLLSHSSLGLSIFLLDGCFLFGVFWVSMQLRKLAQR
jgi:uncharacterized membrane protein